MINSRRFLCHMFFIEVVSFFYLCLIDFYFVVFMKSVEGWYNDIMIVVLISPILSGMVAFKYGLEKYRIPFSLSIALVSAVVLYIKLYWVAIEFHTFIGGEI
jgi:hypothetical protein